MNPNQKMMTTLAQYAVMATAQAVIGWGIQQGIGKVSVAVEERKRRKRRIGFQ